MNPDLALVLGLILGVFSVPSVLSAITDGRAPRVAAFTILAGGSLTPYALTSRPGGYSLQDIPDAFVRVVGQFL